MQCLSLFLRDSRRGSFTLTALFSTTAGLAFLLLFMNLARYVAAVNAVEQAARHTARCLTPTDPQCVALQSSGGPSGDLNWYGNVASSTQPIDTWVDYYNYSAWMNRDTWRATASGFEVHYVDPLASVTGYQVPAPEFQQVWRIYEERFVDRSIDVQQTLPNHASPQAEPQNFPTFDEPYERSVDTSNGWSPRQRSLGPLGINTIYDSWISGAQTGARAADVSAATVRAGNVTSFSSAAISIPNLPAGIDQTTPVLNADGTPFNFGRSLPHGGRTDDWFSHARVAIKADAQVRRADPNQFADLRWGQGTSGAPGSTEGLYVEICGPSGGACRLEPLGGRTYSGQLLATADSNWHWYNLWLRGPAGSHGGNSTITYQNLRVPRGGTIRVIGNIYASGTFGNAEAKVRFRVYFDGYDLQPGEVTDMTVSCTRQQLTQANPNPACPTNPAQECAIPSGFTIVSPCRTGAVISQTPSAGACTPTNRTFVASEKTSTQKVTAATCNASYLPPASALPAPEQGCPWFWESSGSATSILATTPPPPCTLRTAPPLTSPISCERQIFNNSGGYSCAPLETHFGNLNRTIDAYNLQRPANLSPLSRFTQANASWQTLNPSWEFSWSAPQDQSGRVITDPGSVRSSTRSPNDASGVWERSQTAWQPDPSFFDWSTLGGPPPAGASISYQRTSRTRVDIRNSYPLATQAVPELPFFGEPNVADYDRDCSLEAVCAENTPSFANIHEALRHYAASARPEAANRALAFHSSSAISHTELISKNGEALPAGLQTCTPFRTACTNELFVSNEVFLGEYAAASYPSGPPECHDGSYASCRSEFAPGTVIQDQAPTQIVDQDLAKTIGYDEMRRIFRDAKPDCSEAGCMNISVTTDAGPQAEVGVSYELPITFPFDLILGRKSVTVRHRKMEVQELATRNVGLS